MIASMSSSVTVPACECGCAAVSAGGCRCPVRMQKSLAHGSELRALHPDLHNSIVAAYDSTGRCNAGTRSLKQPNTPKNGTGQSATHGPKWAGRGTTAHRVVENHLGAIADHGEQVVLVDALGRLRQPPLLDHQRVQPQLLVGLLDDLACCAATVSDKMYKSRPTCRIVLKKPDEEASH